MKVVLYGLLSLFLIMAPKATVYAEAKISKASQAGEVCRGKDQAEWTLLVYMEANNSLAPFAAYNISDMQRALLPDNINLLVQWDQPNSNKTWRYRIVNGGHVEDATLSAMGHHPVQEMVDAMAWARLKYPAKKNALIFWNHGSGVLDPRHKKINKEYAMGLTIAKPHQTVPWLEIPGLAIQRPAMYSDRGILYDDSKNTYVSNQDLITILSTVTSKILGKNLDLLGMDACLMGMIEVCYQVKDYAGVLVASQNSEPGQGWNYSGFLGELCANPTCDGPQLGASIVHTYGAFYKPRATDYTQSAINLSAVGDIKHSLDQIIAIIAACKKMSAAETKQAVLSARKASINFDIPDYIDLHSFYVALATKFQHLISSQETKGRLNPQYSAAVVALLQQLAAGAGLIAHTVIANTAGTQFPDVRGLSIYYPQGPVQVSYPRTLFAQQSAWLPFIKEFQP